MSIEITPAGFAPDDAEATFRARGFAYFTPLDVPPVENTTHWHSFDSIFSITSAEGYSILLGVSRDPATFEDPVDLPPEDLPR